MVRSSPSLSNYSAVASCNFSSAMNLIFLHSKAKEIRFFSPLIALSSFLFFGILDLCTSCFIVRIKIYNPSPFIFSKTSCKKLSKSVSYNPSSFINFRSLSSQFLLSENRSSRKEIWSAFLRWISALLLSDRSK